MIKKISIFCYLFFALNFNVLAQMFVEQDTIYRLFDSQFDCEIDRQSSFIWDFYNSQIPCYQDGIVRLDDNNVEVQFNDEISNRYFIDGKDFYLSSYKANRFNGKDIGVEFLFEKPLKIYSFGGSIGDQWKELVQCSILFTDDENTEIQQYKWTGLVEMKCKFEASNKMESPGSRINVNLCIVDLSFKKKSLLVKKSNSWQIATKTDIAKLSIFPNNFKLSFFNYWSKRKPYLVGSLELDKDQVCQSLTIYKTTKPPVLSNCDKQKHKIFLYPNPSYGEFKIQFVDQEKGNYDFIIYNVIGEKIYSKSLDVKAINSVLDINLEGMRKGTYLYSIMDENGERLVTKKLVIISI